MERVSAAGSTVMVVKQGDQHADTGNLTKLGDAAEVRRQEREEGGCNCSRGEGQRHSRLARGAAQRALQIVDVVTFRPVSDAELQTEIDSEPDKQDGKRDRDQIQLAHEKKTKGRCRRETHDQCENYRADDSPRAQCQKQDNQDGDHRTGDTDRRLLPHTRVLLVVDRDLARHSYARLEIRRELQVRRRLPDGVGRGAARFQCGEIQFRVCLDEAAQLLGRGRAALHKHAPGEARRPPRQNLRQRICPERERTREVAERNLLVLHAGCREGQGVGNPAQAGVGCQNLEQGSGMTELACYACHLLLRKEQECVAFKEGSSPGLSDELEDIRPCRQ